MDIKIKFIFGQWKKVKYDEAIIFAKLLYKNITNVSDPAKKLELINKHIKGLNITKEKICQ